MGLSNDILHESKNLLHFVFRVCVPAQSMPAIITTRVGMGASAYPLMQAPFVSVSMLTLRGSSVKTVSIRQIFMSRQSVD